MNKRELNISNKKLYEDTPEDIILKSPSRIPPRGLQDLINIKGVKITDYDYYDIAKTENQEITPTSYKLSGSVCTLDNGWCVAPKAQTQATSVLILG